MVHAPLRRGDRCAHQENIVIIITVEDLLRVCDCAHERRMIDCTDADEYSVAVFCLMS